MEPHGSEQGAAAPGAAAAVDLARVRTVAKWADARFLDPVLGLILPGVGDAIGAAAGLYIVLVAVRRGLPHTVVARMLFNLAIDCIGGVVPLVGDFFDLVNRANLRNARLLEQHLAAAGSVDPTGWGSGTSGRGQRGRGKNLALSIALLAFAAGVAIAVAYTVIRIVQPRLS